MNSPSFVWTDRAVRAALGLRSDRGGDLEYAGVTTDSRAAKDGQLYVALVGERFDGHDFVADALSSGCIGAVVSRPVAGAEQATLYPVEDTLVGLGSLATHRRRRLSGTVVGVTGSVGKTMTKELISAAVRTSSVVHSTERNFNNRIGVPLTLLATPEDAEVVVVELGTNEPGEIATLTAISEPDIGVITTVGEVHLEKLGSLAGVMSEKLDLLRGLTDHGRAVVGDDPPELAEAARDVVPEIAVAGWSEEADAGLRPADVAVDHWGHHRFEWQGETVSMQIPGRHAVSNALVALGVARLLGVRPKDAARGVSTVVAGSLRGETRRVGDLTLLLDCYNASPQSVNSALDLLESHGAEARRVAVLGSMLELGDRSEALHREVLAQAVDRRLDLVVATGAFAEAARSLGLDDDDSLIAADEPGAAYERMRGRLDGREVVLLKASRGIALEALVPLFQRDFVAGEA